MSVPKKFTGAPPGGSQGASGGGQGSVGGPTAADVAEAQAQRAAERAARAEAARKAAEERRSTGGTGGTAGTAGTGGTGGTGTNTQVPTQGAGGAGTSQTPQNPNDAQEVLERRREENILTNIYESEQNENYVPPDTTEFVVEPVFNYLAFDYFSNGLSELELPTPYSEMDSYYQNNMYDQEPDFNYGIKKTLGEVYNSLKSTFKNWPVKSYDDQGRVSATYGTRGSDFLPFFNNIVVPDFSAGKGIEAAFFAKQYPNYASIKINGQGVAMIDGDAKSSFKNATRRYASFFLDMFIHYAHSEDENQNFIKRLDFVGNLGTKCYRLWSPNQDTIFDNFAAASGPDHIALVSTNAVLSQTNIQALETKLEQKLEEISTTYSSDSPTYTEELFYKVEKYKNGNLLQTFWLFNDSEFSSIQFVDTQLKVSSGENTNQYQYEFYTYRLFLRQEAGNNNFSVYIAELSKGQQTFEIYQPSLPRPQVSFHNVKDSPTQIKINLQQSVYSQNGPFYELDAAAQSGVDARHSAYDINGTKSKFVYETQQAQYEVYKMLEKPVAGPTIAETYINIKNSSVEGYNPLIVNAQNSTSVMFRDNIQHSTLDETKKYYYIFRSLNVYGFPSNPTPLWEVELQRDADETFLHTNVVPLAKDDEIPLMRNKSMMRLMQIVPSSYQTLFNPPQEDITETVSDAPLLDENGNQIYGYIDQDTGNIIALDPDDDPNNQGSLLTRDSFERTTLSQYNSQDKQLPSLGIEDGKPKIWAIKNHDSGEFEGGIRFKVRVTSKDSGRKIDFNLRFLLEKNYL